ncbi:MAG: MarR family EPS-associated transcriptional regulator [Candidatus Omnitrophica bacterium]|nr:MarR family EPS-associated transcriptional regulator [Candidatus Omnitrophota bacterium]
MNGENTYREETLRLIKEIETNPKLNQRILSQRLNISLGKTNYLLKELVKKGVIKIMSFSRNPKKTRKLKYILTPKGFEQKMMLTYYFLKVKEKEYNNLKKEYEDYIVNREKVVEVKLEEGSNVG